MAAATPGALPAAPDVKYTARQTWPKKVSAGQSVAPTRKLVATAVIAVHILVMGVYVKWWGGLNVIELAFAVVLLGCGITLNGIGATRVGPWWWNVRPTNIDQDRHQLWDWQHPPFLGAAIVLQSARPASR
jgi:hypothetical protein